MFEDLSTWRASFASEVIGDSPQILDALDTVQRVATTECSILITGETGTGKELFARAVHRASTRRHRKFIPINCAAIPEALLESELFGHVKGAFTGAMNPRPGRFVSAHEGTIFLDEIGDLPLSAQAKLLRVLEERAVSPVGSDTDVAVDVRVIAATHRNLEDMVAQGTFRADLYFRLAVVPIELPALRDRAEDIIAIANLAIARTREKLGRHSEGLDESARHALQAYAWPGNVRELCHVIERAVLLARKSTLSDTDLNLPGTKRLARGSVEIPKLVDDRKASGVRPVLPTGPAIPETPDTLDLRTALENLEKDFIEKALKKAGGNRTEAAALLGLNRTTLVEKLRKYAA